MMSGVGEKNMDLDLPVLPLFSQLNIKVDESNKSEWRETSRYDLSSNSTLFFYFSLLAMRKFLLAVRKILKWFMRD